MKMTNSMAKASLTDNPEFEDQESYLQMRYRQTGFWGDSGAGAILFSVSSGKFGLGMRSENVLEPGFLGTFGGAMEEGESVDDTIRRELFEEIGYDGPLKSKHLFTYTSDNGFKYHNAVVIIADRQFQPVLNDENDSIEWFSLDDLLRLKVNGVLHYGVVHLLDDEKSVVSLSKIENTLITHFTDSPSYQSAL